MRVDTDAAAERVQPVAVRSLEPLVGANERDVHRREPDAVFRAAADEERTANADETDACIGGNVQIERNAGPPVLQPPVRLAGTGENERVVGGSVKRDHVGIIDGRIDGERETLRPALEQFFRRFPPSLSRARRTDVDGCA
jgi:hypothetical protein